LEEDREGDVRREAVGDLQEKIQRLGEKVHSLEQENATIKNIHQRTMKKLERLEEKNRAKDEDAPEGEGLQEERRLWLEKTEQLYDEVRRLTKELLLSEESEKKVKEELARCVDIYGQWETERDELKSEIDKLKTGVETYLEKIDELELALSEAKGEVEAMG
jgi:chromosome segregation ATPase